ncbi:MAG: crossover junction endodeoxyribonuclease RuvC [Alloprevotella sp.]|nr:crossover junction endodeoxyribonuclease RuvC [Alloprevotella sp.]
MDRVIMGIDPGTNLMGYGIIHVRDKEVVMEAMGVIDLRKVADVYLKLGRIYERVLGLIDSFHPDELAVEAPFFGKNVQSMLKLGRAQGVAIGAAINRQVPIHEYAPLKIKMAITGNGGASKEQVAEILRRMLKIRETKNVPYLDATDALAAAYCHYLETSREIKSSSGRSSWKKFAQCHQLLEDGASTTPQKKLLNALKGGSKRGK